MTQEPPLTQRCQSMTDVAWATYPENELSKQERVQSWISVHSQKGEYEDMSEQTEDTLNYGFTVAVATTPVCKTNSCAGHCNPSDHDYCHSQSHYTCNCSVPRPPPPYKPPPSYAAINTRPDVSRTMLDSTSSSSYGTACSHMSQDDRQVTSSYTDVHRVEHVGPLRSLYMTKNTEMTKSRASLTESYRMAVHSNDTAVTPIGKSLFSTIRRTESSPSKDFK